MLITFPIYTELGYFAVPEPAFTRFSIKAEQTVHRYTFKRITAENITELNQRGICEVMDLIYNDENQLNKTLSGFSNEGYGEHYALPKETFTLEESMLEVLPLWFTAEQLFRGV